MNKVIIAILLLIIVVVYYYTTSTQRRIDRMVELIIERGILAPNCEWWAKSTNELKDASGVELYYTLKEEYGDVVPVNMLGARVHVVTNVDYIKQILDHSPDTFAVGKYKYKMFKSFMAKNVGVSSGDEWKQRRELNEVVLGTDQLHPYAKVYDKWIGEIVCSQPLQPTTFDDFQRMAKQITTKFVFGSDMVIDEVFDIFSQANSVDAITQKEYNLNPATKQVYQRYLNYYIDNPVPYSLVWIAKQHTHDREELLHQIPHWIFPIGGLIHTAIPRLFTLMCNHPHVCNSKNMQKEPSLRDSTLRKCILETLRLNNPVVTTFRTLTRDWCFAPNECYHKGDQFLILNNPVLRDPEVFDEPNKFKSERWTPKLEDSYSAIMFNQGPQKCPGKDLAIFILQSTTQHYLKKYPLEKCVEIDTDNIPQMMNPCQLKF